ncbi:hypothetical protein HNR53_004435 [Bacillus benzoevorans]|uniref:Uncharacterized protein n=1 Tax=Bacillus benzoevorans TaxID=1456 RepID=A0A7X0HY32_9BACI|nr:hypothetical protein [Bacillus benzoevorans]
MYLESRRLVKGGCKDDSEWTCEGSLKSEESRRLRDPARYQWGVYDCIHKEWTIFRQFGWYRRSHKAFVPFSIGIKAFFIVFFSSGNDCISTCTINDLY